MKDSAANIVGVFIRAAQTWPQQTALVQGKRSVSYAELYELVRQAAGGLEARGIRQGDAVLVAVPMSIELYTTVLALFYRGAIPVFVDAWVGRSRMAQSLGDIHCKGIIAPGRLLWLSMLAGVLRRIPVKCTPSALLRSRSRPEPAFVASHHTALITFTTGSSGSPKAANRTHELLHAQLAALRPILPSEQQTGFTTLPIVVLLHLAMGTASVLPPPGYSMRRPGSIRHLHDALLERNVQSIVVAPSVMDLLIRRPRLPALQHIITGGGPVFPDLASRMLSAFPDAHITVVYGSTEAEPISHIAAAQVAAADSAMLREWGLPVGVPDPAATVRIIPCNPAPIKPMTGDAWRALCLPPGEVGEIVVSGEHVLKQYVNHPYAETVSKIQVGGSTWHRTGDAGRMDEAGRLFLLGRCTEMLDLPHRRIYPAIVAYELMQATGITGAAVLSTTRGIAVVLESRGASDRQAVEGILAEYGLAAARIIRTAKLPRDPRHMSKVDYTALRRRYA